MDGLISVIVPVYNMEKYLKRCLDSILGQTYSKLEIILVDDGSTDKSPALCDEYAKRDSRVRAFHKTQGGLSDARNFGIARCHGDYVSFIDSDDYIAPTMLERLLRAMAEGGAQLGICSFCCQDEDGRELTDMNAMSPIRDGVFSKEDILRELTKANYWYYVTAWNKLYQRDLLSAESFLYGKYHEDEFFIHHLLEKCDKISCVGERLYYYIRRQGSITQTKNPKRELDSVGAMLDRLKFFWNRGSVREAGEMMNFVVDGITLSYSDFQEKKEKEAAREYGREAKRFYRALNEKKAFSKKKRIKYFLFFYGKPLYIFLYNKKYH